MMGLRVYEGLLVFVGIERKKSFIRSSGRMQSKILIWAEKELEEVRSDIWPEKRPSYTQAS